MARRFLAIGECMIEFAPTSDGTYAIGFAGDTFNTAWYARRLAGRDHIEVAYLSAVGDDSLSHQLTGFMDEAGIAPCLATVQGSSPGVYLIVLNEGERSFQYWRSRSAARHLADDLSPLDGFGRGDMLYFSGITVAILPENSRTRLLEAVDAASARGAAIVFDPNLRPRLWTDAEEMCRWTTRAAQASDIVLPSFDDEATHFEDNDPEATARRYLENGARLAVVKNGAGAVLVRASDGDGFQYQPDPVTEIVDTTAAGDSFNAAFLIEYLEKSRLREAVRAGCALARHVICHRGALVPVSRLDLNRHKVSLPA